MNPIMLITFFSVVLMSSPALCMGPAAPAGETKRAAPTRCNYATFAPSGNYRRDLERLTPPAGNYMTNKTDWDAFWAIHQRIDKYKTRWNIKESNFCCATKEKLKKRLVRLMIKVTFLTSPDEEYNVDAVANELYPRIALTKEEKDADDARYSSWVKYHYNDPKANEDGSFWPMFLGSMHTDISGRRTNYETVISCDHDAAVSVTKFQLRMAKMTDPGRFMMAPCTCKPACTCRPASKEVQAWEKKVAAATQYMNDAIAEYNNRFGGLCDHSHEGVQEITTALKLVDISCTCGGCLS